VFEFVQRFFGKPASSTTAKERLRLVLLSDHLSLAPDVVEALKRDLVEVISRYVEVDSSNCDVTFEQQDKQVAMLANIPILAMRQSRPRATGSAQLPAAPPEPPPVAAHEPERQPELALESEALPTDGAASGASRSQRRRRRKRAAAASSASPQPT
jgi:cell division topological specificity factor